jgi:hypothetical protein
MKTENGECVSLICLTSNLSTTISFVSYQTLELDQCLPKYFLSIRLLTKRLFERIFDEVNVWLHFKGHNMEIKTNNFDKVCFCQSECFPYKMLNHHFSKKKLNKHSFAVNLWKKM